jgi:hypothetical protein
MVIREDDSVSYFYHNRGYDPDSSLPDDGVEEFRRQMESEGTAGKFLDSPLFSGRDMWLYGEQYWRFPDNSVAGEIRVFDFRHRRTYAANTVDIERERRKIGEYGDYAEHDRRAQSQVIAAIDAAELRTAYYPEGWDSRRQQGANGFAVDAFQQGVSHRLLAGGRRRVRGQRRGEGL